MSTADLTQNWALVAAAVLALVVVLLLLVQMLKTSARGRLVTDVRHLQQREKAQRNAQKAVDKARVRLERLQSRPDSARPRLVDEAREALTGAETDLRLIDDQVLIARNRVRTVILEEYPPKRQRGMRRRFLGEEE